MTASEGEPTDGDRREPNDAPEAQMTASEREPFDPLTASRKASSSTL